MSKRFFPLEICTVIRETKDAVTICLDIPKDLQESFGFQAGQHLTVKAEIEGEEVRRNYSLSSAPHEDKICFTVKHVVNGRFSSYANGHLRAGMNLDVMPPIGKFTYPFSREHHSKYVAFAAGSGITPIMSLLKTGLTTESESSFVLFFGNKEKNDVIFLEELEGLKNRFIERISIHHIFSKQVQEFTFLNGRIDSSKCETSAR
ncbi:MAG: FAD-binding oxidoreductase, partial [Saprospiraceae bacterium]|nr:FAD-binding oxidoreductase [Saprospiraceae bacterium]